ncbi:MAG: Asp23/Gls24 family envelope stress response protein [Peptoniphilaceae bacterium]|nr:Asp23/Gls24 family envelope stress response protein [Peptoniphilaceae bacterium]MDY6085585.1 Asp23/Gls24 family envelope stress response protein [Peptoniphilaceae bacterium]
MTSKVQTPLGDLFIDDQVIARIVCRTTMESYGIVGLAAQSPKDQLYHLLGMDNMTRGVKVYCTGEQSVWIQIHVIMDSGVRLATVVSNVIDSVRYNVETKTGLHVDSVDVIVQGLRA